MKEIGASVEQAITDSVNGKFTATPYVGTLENGGVSIAPFHDFDSKVPSDLKDELTKLTDQIKKGELKVESATSPKGRGNLRLGRGGFRPSRPTFFGYPETGARPRRRGAVE